MPHQALRHHQFIRIEDGLERAVLDAGCGEQHAAFGRLVGIGHVDLQQEAVELRLWQWIGALLLERVLGGEYVEGTRHVVADAGHGDMMLLHRL